MPYLVFLAALSFVASPLLTPGFGGFEPNQFPVPQNNPPAQPAGYAFAIWGLIYLWLVIATGFQMLWRKTAADWVSMRPALFASLAIGAFWLPVALVSPLGATVLIWAMQITAVLALCRCPDRDAAFASGPVGLYAGWLTAAASISLALIGAGWGFMTGTNAAILALAIALTVTLVVMTRRATAITYPVGVIWALIAVVVANWADGPQSVIWFATAGAVGIAAFATVTNYRRL
ncbi:hypothetical protein G5B38_05085 [Pseudohalocynthiibacter aestuariivivens]|uniref:TspO and MBR related proteins n=1 Tax=Roseovarius pelagicus TaxID=2980108 RepID=A0ABY6DAX3_9RHOB|nr:hypothetical protein [Roseovarius pelagicus]QIE44950.1 hypothetical protein G5B38_05085 [Pseudohalocynthiibacter aestuariivivens]UXX83134.1 hypothetical protein N7U68_18980 [Roseovarius pelagicus]